MQDEKANSSAELFRCRGKSCKSEWPRTKVCFYVTTDTADRLSYICKFCNLKSSQGRPKGKKAKRITRTLNQKETEDLLLLVKPMINVVPKKYIATLFELTNKQYSRILVLTGVNRKKLIKGSDLLSRWRHLSKFKPIITLSPQLNAKLELIWKEDVREYVNSLKLKDIEDYRLMEEAMKSSPFERKIRCRGGCDMFYPPDKFFFPVVAGKFKFFCAVCNRKRFRPIVHRYD